MDATMMAEPLLIDGILERAGTLHGNQELVSQLPDKTLRRHSYAELRTRARALAQGLSRAGLTKGDRVATLCWNHHAHVEVYFGAPLAGGVYHTLNLRLGPEDLVYILKDAGDRFLVVDDVLLPLFQRVADQVDLDGVFVVRLTDAPLPEGFTDYEELLAGADPAWEPEPKDENDAAGLCYTSGTTGKPKGVAYSHRAVVLHSMASALPDTLCLSQEDTLLPVVPMFHANAWGLPFTAALVGAKQVHPGPHLDPVSLLNLYQAERVNVSAGVPTIWAGILQHLESGEASYDLSEGLRMIVGGSAVPEAMIRAMDAQGMRVIQAWGMTEMTPLGSVAAPPPDITDADERYAFRARQGVPAPLVEARAMGDDGTPVPWDGEARGELEVRGPWVASAYVGGVAPEKWSDDGWFRTGDVVTIDARGCLKIVDRTKDLIKSGGEWISSVDMENYLMGHAGVRLAAVVAVPDEKWGERPVAVLVAKSAPVPDEELREHLAPHYPKWALPDRFEWREDMPLTATGKVLKRALRAELGGA
jgi:fatty-acyl-CoA synthase